MSTPTLPTDHMARTYVDVQRIADNGGCLNDMWRFGILQALDFYATVRKYAGLAQAQELFKAEPKIDVEPLQRAYAALAEFLAQRDGWVAPEWTQKYVSGEPWLPAARPEYDLPDRIIDQSVDESPTPFRHRNIYITMLDLARA